VKTCVRELIEVVVPILLATSFATLLGVALLVTAIGRTSCARRRRSLAPAALCLLSIALGSFSLADFVSGAADEPEAKPAKKPSDAPSRKLVAPKGWPEGLPLPRVASNCAACHLTAGRELTDAVKHLVRSVHDLNDMTCYDCHGGNRENDVKAHEPEFGFIGTKISAHIKQCSECHTDEAERLAAGPHHWDFSTRVNLKYPTCIDCHGNHDVGNPPADFKLTNMCLDCHNKLEKDWPNIASVINGNDQLADVLRKVRQKNIREKDPIPAKFHKDVAALRTDTMRMVHASKEVTAEKAKDLNARGEKLRGSLEEWLKASK
jgi:Cytochrome c3